MPEPARTQPYHLTLPERARAEFWAVYAAVRALFDRKRGGRR